MTEWEVIEENDQIKAEFTGYKDGAVRLKTGGWAMLPTTAAMIDTYKVWQGGEGCYDLAPLYFSPWR